MFLIHMRNVWSVSLAALFADIIGRPSLKLNIQQPNWSAIKAYASKSVLRVLNSMFLHPVTSEIGFYMKNCPYK